MLYDDFPGRGPQLGRNLAWGVVVVSVGPTGARHVRLHVSGRKAAVLVDTPPHTRPHKCLAPGSTLYADSYRMHARLRPCTRKMGSSPPAPPHPVSAHFRLASSCWGDGQAKDASSQRASMVDRNYWPSPARHSLPPRLFGWVARDWDKPWVWGRYLGTYLSTVTSITSRQAKKCTPT